MSGLPHDTLEQPATLSTNANDDVFSVRADKGRIAFQYVKKFLTTRQARELALVLRQLSNQIERDGM